MSQNKFPIYLENNKIFSNSISSYTLFDSKKIGEKKDNKIIYSPYEALFLLERSYSELIKNKKSLNFEKALKSLSRQDKSIYQKYLVFKLLRSKGYIVKEGLKFGGEFRIYEQHKLAHAKYICHVVTGNKLDIKEIIAKIRITHTSGKKLLLAIIDKEEDIIFYEMDWIKP